MATTRSRLIAAVALASLLTIAACTDDSSSSDTSIPVLATTSVAESDLPGAMKAIMSKPRYRDAVPGACW